MTKQVFVWKGYGYFSIYAADTPEQLQDILTTVYTVALQNTYEDVHDKMQRTYEKNKDTKTKALINWLIEEVGDGCDSFEYGTGFYEVKEKCT